MIWAGRPLPAFLISVSMKLRELAAGVVGRDHQVLEAGPPVVALEKAEDPAHFAGDPLVGGEEAVIRVNPCGGLVEVAGADVGVQHGPSGGDTRLMRICLACTLRPGTPLMTRTPSSWSRSDQ